MRRRSPVTFFHGILFVTGGGVALLWTRWGWWLVIVGGLAAYATLKVKASGLDMAAEKRKLDQLHDELTDLYQLVDPEAGEGRDPPHAGGELEVGADDRRARDDDHPGGQGGMASG